MSPLGHALSIAAIIVLPWGLFLALASVLAPKKEKIK